MKIPRSEAVDKSPGVFFDPEQHFKGPGTPGAIKQAKKPIFPKIPKFPKNCKKYKNIPFWLGPGWALAGPSTTQELRPA